MYKFKVYLFTAILITLVFVTPFLCKQPGNQVNIDHVGDKSSVIIEQNEDTNFIIIGNSIEKGYTGENEDKLQRIIDSLESHGYQVIDTAGKRKGGENGNRK